MEELTLRFREREAPMAGAVADFAGTRAARPRVLTSSGRIVGGPGPVQLVAQLVDHRSIPAPGAASLPDSTVFRGLSRAPVWVLPMLPMRPTPSIGSGSRERRGWSSRRRAHASTPGVLLAWCTAAGLVTAPFDAFAAHAQPASVPPTLPTEGGAVVSPASEVPPPAPTVAAAPPPPEDRAREAIDAAWQGVVGRMVRFTTGDGRETVGLVGAVQRDTFTLILPTDGRVQVLRKADVVSLRVDVAPSLPPSGAGLLAGGGVLVGIGAPVFLTGVTFLAISAGYPILWAPMLLIGGAAAGGGIGMLVRGAQRRQAFRAAQHRRIGGFILPGRGGAWAGGLSLRF